MSKPLVVRHDSAQEYKQELMDSCAQLKCVFEHYSDNHVWKRNYVTNVAFGGVGSHKDICKMIMGEVLDNEELTDGLGKYLAKGSLTAYYFSQNINKFENLDFSTWPPQKKGTVWDRFMLRNQNNKLVQLGVHLWQIMVLVWQIIMNARYWVHDNWYLLCAFLGGVVLYYIIMFYLRLDIMGFIGLSRRIHEIDSTTSQFDTFKRDTTAQIEFIKKTMKEQSETIKEHGESMKQQSNVLTTMNQLLQELIKANIPRQ